MTNTRLLRSAALAVTLAFGAASAEHGIVKAQAGTAPSAQAGPSRMGQMMAARQKMQAEMEAQAKKLDELVARMNAAKGGDKVDRVAAALTELVSQHTAMHRRMMGPGGMMAMPPQAPGPTLTPAQGGRAEPAFPQGHDQHTQARPTQGQPTTASDEEMCLPAV